MSMTKDVAKQLGAEVAAVLQSVAEKHGLQVKVAGGTYDSAIGTFSPKVEFFSDDTARVDFERYADFFGLTPADFGRTFTTAGRTFAVVGVNRRASKRPILCESEGRTYTFPAAAVKMALA